MVIGIKYCGGCNPVYDRVKRMKALMEQNPGHEYTYDPARVCDLWMVVCGCSRRCADTSGLKAKQRTVLLWDEESFRRLEEELRITGQEKKTGETAVYERKVLRLHETAVSKRVMTREDICCFAGLTGDTSGLHSDRELALRAGFEGPLVHGMFLDSLVSALMGTKLPGNGTLYLEHSTRFIRPVYEGDTVEITVEFLSCEEQEDCYIGVFRGTCRNQKGERVLTARCSQMMKKSLFHISGLVES